MNRRAFTWLALSLSLSACSDEDSQKLETKEIRLSCYVERDDDAPDTLEVEAYPYRGGSPQGVDFNDGDRVEVTTNAMATPLVLKRGPIGGYFGDLPKGDHREVIFSLVRSEKVSAPASKVNVMPFVTFDAAPAGRSVSYASGGLDLRWPNPTAGARFELEIAKPCDTATVTAGDLPEPPSWDDTGTLTIPPALLSPTPPPAGGACVLVLLNHVLSGSTDPALNAGSTAVALQRFSFEITLVP